MSSEDKKFAELMARQERMEARLLRLEEHLLPRSVVRVAEPVPVEAVTTCEPTAEES